MIKEEITKEKTYDPIYTHNGTEWVQVQIKIKKAGEQNEFE